MMITSIDRGQRLNPRVLIVDNDAGLRTELAAYLTQNGCVARTASGAREMDEAVASEPFDLVVLEVMMRGGDGLSLCRRTACDGGPPIIIMSALGDETDRIVGLELGADDYMAKPCSPRELLARVRAVLRGRSRRPASPRPQATEFEFLGYRLDVLKRTLLAPSGAIIPLSDGEFSLLIAFLENPGRTMSRADLAQHTGRTGGKRCDRTVDVQLSRLRQKLKECNGQALIRTCRGAGYVFRAQLIRRRPASEVLAAALCDGPSALSLPPSRSIRTQVHQRPSPGSERPGFFSVAE